MQVTVERSLRVAAVLPALNESGSIVDVVRAIGPYARAIVVDDGSTDGTGELARIAGAEVVSHERNLGYDMALTSGLRRAVELGFDAAITMDADGQHDPAILLSFISALQDGAVVVVGSRDRHQRWAESLFALVGSVIWSLRDPLCGMKAYRVELLRQAEPLMNYESIGTELALRAARARCRIAQVAVQTRPRTGTSRFGTGFRANWRIFRALMAGLASRRGLS